MYIFHDNIILTPCNTRVALNNDLLIVGISDDNGKVNGSSGIMEMFTVKNQAAGRKKKKELRREDHV